MLLNQASPDLLIGLYHGLVDEGVPGAARLGTWLMPEDLATADTLIMAGIATTRAEAMRWALGRIRENPVYAELQERMREANELQAQF